MIEERGNVSLKRTRMSSRYINSMNTALRTSTVPKPASSPAGSSRLLMAVTYASVNDPVATVVSVLSDNWAQVASNVDSTTPTIDESWDMGKKNLKNGDLIRCYEVAANHDFLGIGDGVDKGTARVSIDISTSVSRSRLRKLYSGVVSIIRGARAGNSSTALHANYADVKLLSRIDQSDKNRRWYRYVLDCEITSYEAVV